MDPAKPALEYSKPPGFPSSRWKQTVLWTFAGLILFANAVVWLSGLANYRYNHGGGESTRLHCASNLKQVGFALILYANEYHDRFPDSLKQSLAAEDIVPEVLVCPASNDTRAAGPTTRAVLDDFEKPGHCSYIYLGKGLTTAASADTVLAYEPLWDHQNTGMNVLFADGRVEFLAAPGVLPWIANAKGGPVVRPSPPSLSPRSIPAGGKP